MLNATRSSTKFTERAVKLQSSSAGTSLQFLKTLGNGKRLREERFGKERRLPKHSSRFARSLANRAAIFKNRGRRGGRLGRTVVPPAA